MLLEVALFVLSVVAVANVAAVVDTLLRRITWRESDVNEDPALALRLGRPRRVAVIGAGPAGLAMLRELSASGHDCIAFEASHDLGGAFAAAYDGCLLTTSSTNTAFSSFFPSERDSIIW